VFTQPDPRDISFFLDMVRYIKYAPYKNREAADIKVNVVKI